MRSHKLLSIAYFLGTLLFVFCVLEAGLRAFPDSLIPISWLKRFNGEIRTEIAQRLQLPRKDQMWELPRDDGGPPLFLFRPKIRTEQVFSQNERSIIVRDSRGFCNPLRDSYEVPQIDILILGDSFADCIAAHPEGSWMSRVGQISGRSVYNLGKGGIGPYEYLQLLKYFGLQKKPVIVVMNIYEGNDLRDILRYRDYVAGRGPAAKVQNVAGNRFVPEIDYESLLNNYLGRNSYAVNVSCVSVGKLKDIIQTAVKIVVGNKDVTPIDFRYNLNFDRSILPFNVDNLDDGEVKLARKIQSGAVSFDAFAEVLESFRALADEWGFVPVISYSPAAYTAYAKFREFADVDHEALMTRFSAAQRRYFREKTEALNIEFIDLTPTLQNEVESRQEKDLLYYPVNVHFSPSGHQVVGSALGERVMELSLDHSF